MKKGSRVFFIGGLVILSVFTGCWGNNAPFPQPPAPVAFLSALPGNGQAILDWNDSPDPHFAGYNLYRALISGGPYTKLNATLLLGSTYTDTGLTNGTTYYYVVRVMNKQGMEGPPSDPISVTPRTDFTPPAAPQGFTAFAGDNFVLLNWAPNNEPDLSHYFLYRNTFPGIPQTEAFRIARINPANSYNDASVTNGTTYWYCVSAVDTSNNESPCSIVLMVTPVLDIVDPVVTVLSPNGGEVIDNGSPTLLQWTSSDNIGVLAQEIRLSTDGGNTYPTVIATGLPGAQQSYTWNVPSNLASTTARIKVIATDASGNSGEDASDANFTIRDGVPPSIQVNSPNGDETFNAGSPMTIQWTSSDNIGVTEQNVFRSSDGGANWQAVEACQNLPGNVQSCTVTPPADLNSTTMRVKVEAKDAAGNSSEDASDGNFTIQDVTNPLVQVTYPNGGESFNNNQQVDITWTSSDPNQSSGWGPAAVATQTVAYSTDNGQTWTDIGDCIGLPDTVFNCPWTVPNDVATTQALVRVTVTDTANNTTSDSSDGTFTINDIINPTVAVTSPNGGETFNAGSPMTIQWTSSDNIGVTEQNVFRSSDGGANWQAVEACQNLPGNVQSCTVTPPADLNSTTMRVKVEAKDAAGNSSEDASDGNFTIQDVTNPLVQVTYPNGGESFNNNQQVDITWTSSDPNQSSGWGPAAVATQTVAYSTDNGQTWTDIGDCIGLPDTVFNCPWTVPNDVATTQALVRVTVTDTAGLSSSDTSDATFTIVDSIPPSVTVNAPNGGENVPGGATYNIQWTSSDNISITDQDAYVSTDSGANWVAISECQNVVGQQCAWNTPAINNTTSRVRVCVNDGVNPEVCDDSDADFSILTDTTPPETTITSGPAEGSFSNQNTATFEFTGNDPPPNPSGINRLECNLDNAGWNTCTSPFTTPALTDGLHNFQVRAVDNLGNIDATPDFRNWTVDTTPPDLTITAPTANGHVAGGTGYQIQWTSSDAVSGLAGHSSLQYSTDSGTNWTDIPEAECSGYTAPTAQDCTWNVPANLWTPTATAKLRLTATDNAGNTRTSESELFLFDDVSPPTPPTVIAPNGGEMVDAPSTYTIEWTSPTDNVGIQNCDILLSTDGGATYPTTIAAGIPCSTYAWSVNPDLFTGKARIRVVAHDLAGNTSDDDSDANFIIVFYERWESEADPTAFGEQHPTTFLMRWWQFLFGGDANCPGPPTNPYRWYFGDDNGVFGAPQGNHSPNWFRWDVCNNDPNYYYPPGDQLGLVAGPFDFTDATAGTLNHNSQWAFDNEDIGRLLISAPLASPTSACNTAATYYLLDHITGTSPNFGTAFESISIDLSTITTPEGPVLGTTRCIGFITFDIDGDGDGGIGFGWFIDDIRVTKN